MNKYEIIIYWSNEDACFIAEVPELPGCVAHGSTAQEALAQAETAMTLWMESAAADGVTILEPKGHRLVFA